MNPNGLLFWDEGTMSFAQAAIAERDTETLVATLCNRVTSLLRKVAGDQIETVSETISRRVGHILVETYEDIDIDALVDTLDGLRMASRDAFTHGGMIGFPETIRGKFSTLFTSMEITSVSDMPGVTPLLPDVVAIEAREDEPVPEMDAPVLEQYTPPIKKPREKRGDRSPKAEKKDEPIDALPFKERSVGSLYRNGGSYGNEMWDGGVQLFLREMGKTPLLTRKEEIELAMRIRRGDPEAREHMIKANLRLVVKIAQDYTNFGLSLADLIAEGSIGLMKAVERFDPDYGSKLSTYAAWWIKQSMKRALANQSKTIRLPVHMYDKISKLQRVSMTLSEELGRAPTDDELSEVLGIARESIAMFRAAALRPVSLDAPISADDPTEFGEIVGDEKAVDAGESLISTDLLSKIPLLLSALDEREREIIELRFGLNGHKPLTLDQVGQQRGVTRERIRQLQKIALKKMFRELQKMDNPILNHDFAENDPAGDKKTQKNSLLNQKFLTNVRKQAAQEREKTAVFVPNGTILSVKPTLPISPRIRAHFPLSPKLAKNTVEIGSVIADRNVQKMLRASYLGEGGSTRHTLSDLVRDFELPEETIRATLIDMGIPLRKKDSL